MKQKKRLQLLALVVLCLAQTLLLMPQKCAAQYNDAFSKMKTGDWFELLVSDTARIPDHESYRYQIRYVLKNTDSEGNREYRITFERVRAIFSYTGHYPPLGFDSFYPRYEQGIPHQRLNPRFLSKVDHKGKIIHMKPEYDFPGMQLYEISRRKSDGGTSIDTAPLPKETATEISKHIMEAFSDRATNWCNGNTYKNSGLSFVLSAASFPVAANTIVEGNIRNLKDDAGFDIYLPDAKTDLPIEKDGSFKHKALLTEGSEAMITYGKLRIPLFLQPGDTLRIYADATDLLKTMKFSGKAANMASYALKLAAASGNKKAPEIEYGTNSFSATDFMKAQETDLSAFRQLNEKYKNTLTASTIKYYQLRFAFEQAKARLIFLSNAKYKSSPEATEIFEGFPDHFFKSIDTLPILMVDYNNAGWYNSFFNPFHMYQMAKTNQLSGSTFGFFLSDYVLLLNHLRRFPLYATLSDAFQNELEQSSWKTAQTLKPYYEDFIKNCGDTTLTNPVKQYWDVLASWAPGKKMPLKYIQLSDNNQLNLSKYKGKALSITFNFHYPDEMKRLLGRIRKQDPDKVRFLIVQLKEENYPPSTVAETLRKLPNVDYIEISRESSEDLEEKMLLSHFDIKTFVVDADQTVIQDNIDDSPNRLSQEAAFEEALKKALAPKTMSRADRAELIKIMGWSLGSILCAGLVFFWIYKARVKAIKTRESVKQQIKELEIKAIRSQMNPHFIFNALNSIQSLINNRQYKEASIYLEKFSLLMRQVLNNSEQTFVSLSDELTATTLYAELEKLRFDFSFIIEIAQDINTDLIEIPGMIIQPLIENAVLHGIAQKRTTGRLNIKIDIIEKSLRIMVKDNGIGLNTKSPEKKNGFGLKLVRERLELLNAAAIRGNLEITSNPDHDGGVTATLTIPLD